MTEIKQPEGQPEVNHSSPDKYASRWIRLSLLSLLIVEILGCAVRYRFPRPFHGNMLEAYTGFFYAGWMTQVLMTLLVRYLARRTNPKAVWKKYNRLLWANLLTSYGLLIAYSIMGYGIVSVIFLTLSIFVSYAFTAVYWPDLNRLPKRLISRLWFKSALAWNVISSLGAFALAYLILADVKGDAWIRAICFYHHFQYNGWFLFACCGLLYSSNIGTDKEPRNVFYMMLLSCGPAYFISILSATMTTIPYGIAIMGGIIQLIGWISIASQTFNGGVVLTRYLRPTTSLLLLIAGIAGTLKFLFQVSITYPPLLNRVLENNIFGIAYLHLVFIGLLTMFIIAYLFHNGAIEAGGWRKQGVNIFVIGFVLELIFMMIQAFGDLSNNLILFVPELIMLLGILLLNIGAAMKPAKKDDKKAKSDPTGVRTGRRP